MMELEGKRVEIIVGEPWEWEGDLQGTIISEKTVTFPHEDLRKKLHFIDSDIVLVELTRPAKGKKFTSRLLSITPRYEGQNFDLLFSKDGLTVGGYLVNEITEEIDYVIIGSARIVH